MGGAGERSSGAPAPPGDQETDGWLRVGGWAAIGAGVFGLLGLLSVIPWPELFGLDARPANALVFDPGLKVVLVGHYAILVAGAACGLAASVVLVRSRRQRLGGLIGPVMLVAACAALAYASAVRAIDLAVSDGRSTEDVASVVWAGGGLLLVAVVLVTLALRQRAGTVFLLLGLGTPVLVAAGVGAFAAMGPDVYPEIWGVTFPPPSDYLLALWFIALGRVMRAGPRVRADTAAP